MRTREGMAVARAKGRLRGKQPKLSARQEAHLVALHQAGEHTTSELEELFAVTRSTVYRAIQRSRAPTDKSAGEPLLSRPLLPEPRDAATAPRLRASGA